MSFIWQSIDGMGRDKLKLGMGPIPTYHQSKGCVLKEYKFKSVLKVVKHILHIFTVFFSGKHAVFICIQIQQWS